MNIPPKDGEISAAALMVSLVARYPGISEDELLRLARRRGLRAGALPVVAGKDLLRELNLMSGELAMALTDAGATCLQLLDGGEEPTARFRDVLIALSFDTAEAKLILANVEVDAGGHVSDSRGIAEPLLEYLAEAGVITARTDGSWQFVDGARPISLGTLLAGDSPSAPAESFAVGIRGELLSIQYELERTGCYPLQVSQISSSFGFDLQSIEESGSMSEIAIEVKATTGTRLLVNWSANEARTSLLLAERYLLHIWGEVDLSKSPDHDFARLTAIGYPRIVAHPAAAVRHVIGVSSDWVQLGDSAIRTDNFQWEFWTRR